MTLSLPVTVLLVTYGNRFGLLKQVLDELCSKQQITAIWVYDNASKQPDAQQLRTYGTLQKKVNIIHSTTNDGTAYAYTHMFTQLMQKHQNSFVWCLDDDNLPNPDALAILLNQFNKLQQTYGDKLVLYSYRGDTWADDYLAVFNCKIKKPIANAFAGFHIWLWLKEKFSSKRSKTAFLHNNEKNNFAPANPVAIVHYGPYGGFFTLVKNLEIVDMPHIPFFVYADDHAFTYQFHQKGFKQFLIYRSQIIDLDNSHADNMGYFGSQASTLKLFYGLRNTTYFYKLMPKSNLIYNINKFSFSLLILLLALKAYKNRANEVNQRLKLIFKALKAGENGHLGKVNIK